MLPIREHLYLDCSVTDKLFQILDDENQLPAGLSYAQEVFVVKLHDWMNIMLPDSIYLNCQKNVSRKWWKIIGKADHVKLKTSYQQMF